MSTVIHIRTSRAQPLILLPTSINGEGPFDLVLDTGAGTTVITEEIATRIGLEATEVREGIGAAGKKIEVSLARADRVSIGGAAVRHLRVGIVTEFPRCAGQGAIGHNFLSEFVLAIDYRNNLLALTSSEERIPGRGEGERVPLRIAGPKRPVPMLDMLVNECSAYPFVLDTGASHTLVSPALAGEMGVSTDHAGPITGAGGEVQSSVGRLRSISAGAARRESLPVVVSDIFGHLSQALGVQVEGILGYDFLSGFRVVLNYVKKTVSFEQ